MNYFTYINSELWKNKRDNFVKICGGCEVCGKTKNLNVHHKSYNNLGRETIDDVFVLCSYHHKKVHFSNKGNFFNYDKRNKSRVESMKKCLVFNRMKPTLKCNRCGKMPLFHFYNIWKNGSKHFMVACKKCGIHKQKKIIGLNIPEITTQELKPFKRDILKLKDYFIDNSNSKCYYSLNGNGNSGKD